MVHVRALATLFIAAALVSTGVACGGSGESAEAEVEDLGSFAGKADAAALRQVGLELGPGLIKRYRIKATGFVARLSQAEEVPARLSAKHYEIDLYGEISSNPTVTASSAEGIVRNWTLRVENLGKDVLRATVLVTELPPAAAPELGIVSDIDKTLLPPGGEGDALPAPYPGVVTLLRELEFGGGGRPGDVTFVTARTPERAEGVDVWMASHGIPAGPIETGISGMPWIAQPEKVRDISRVFDLRPDQQFVLFGDSSHRDPEVYREIIAAYPDRVIAAFIHKVNNPSASRVEGLHLIESYAEAAGILFGLGTVDEASARRVMIAARDEGLALSDDAIDALIDDGRASQDGPSGDCAGELRTTVEPLIADLWYPSESDEPFHVFVAKSETTGPITPDEVIRLAGLDAGVVQETRSFDDFFEYLVEDETDGERYTALKRALWAGLTELVVVRLDEVEVQVFVVGRNACGEVAGVRTMSVET